MSEPLVGPQNQAVVVLGVAAPQLAAKAQKEECRIFSQRRANGNTHVQSERLRSAVHSSRTHDDDEVPTHTHTPESVTFGVCQVRWEGFSFLSSFRALPSGRPNICHNWETFLGTPFGSEARKQMNIHSELLLPRIHELLTVPTFLSTRGSSLLAVPFCSRFLSTHGSFLFMVPLYLRSLSTYGSSLRSLSTHGSSPLPYQGFEKAWCPAISAVSLQSARTCVFLHVERVPLGLLITWWIYFGPIHAAKYLIYDSSAAQNLRPQKHMETRRLLEGTSTLWYLP